MISVDNSITTGLVNNMAREIQQPQSPRGWSTCPSKDEVLRPIECLLVLMGKGEKGVERVLRWGLRLAQPESLEAAHAKPRKCTSLRAGNHHGVLSMGVTCSYLCFIKITGNSVQNRLKRNKTGASWPARRLLQ